MIAKTIKYKGFTLAEVLVASTISAFIAMVAVGSLKTVSDSAQIVNRASETTAEVRFAARMLARDLANLYRDRNPEDMKLVGASQTSDSASPGSLTFYMVGRAKARADQPEGDVYEVQYLLGERQASDAAAGEPAGGAMLLRRLWPNPDRERPPGGILTPIAQNIDVFQVRFFNGEQWATEWPEEMQSLPQLVEVTLATVPRDRGQPVVETFIANFARLVEQSAAAGQGQGQGQAQPNGQGQQAQGRGQGTTQTGNQGSAPSGNQGGRQNGNRGGGQNRNQGGRQGGRGGNSR